MAETLMKNIAAGIESYRADFPALSNPMNGKSLAYLDTASSAQKPQIVLDRMNDLAVNHYANIHRGLYKLSQVATQEYESVRGKVADFINAPSEKEIVFTRNATEGINLVAQSWGRTHLKAGDEIIVSRMEHHANIVPWQLLETQCGVVIKVIDINADGTLDLESYERLLSNKTRLVAVTAVSNALGTINPVEKMATMAKSYDPSIVLLADCSQAVVHGGVDVQALRADFIVFTGHKLYGPTGIGVLWGRYELLDSMPPYQGGGDMIETVSFASTTFKSAPARFEAGTPAIIEVVGLGAAIDYVRSIGMDDIMAHEASLLSNLQSALAKIDGLNFYGTAKDKAGIVSFTASWGQASDVAMILDKCGVAVRTGHHCCMPLMNAMGVQGTIRASLGLYSNQNDIDALVAGLRKAKEMLS